VAVNFIGGGKPVVLGEDHESSCHKSVVYVISQPPIIKFKFELSQVEKYRNPMVAEGGPVSPMTKNVNFLRL
jgi:hypothetical protein